MSKNEVFSRWGRKPFCCTRFVTRSDDKIMEVFQAEQSFIFKTTKESATVLTSNVLEIFSKTFWKYFVR